MAKKKIVLPKRIFRCDIRKPGNNSATRVRIEAVDTNEVRSILEPKYHVSNIEATEEIAVPGL